MMQLIAVNDDSMYMVADGTIESLSPRDTCIVFDENGEQLAPPLCIGSWTARVFPWETPTEEQKKKAKAWIGLVTEDMMNGKYRKVKTVYTEPTGYFTEEMVKMLEAEEEEENMNVE